MTRPKMTREPIGYRHLIRLSAAVLTLLGFLIPSHESIALAQKGTVHHFPSSQFSNPQPHGVSPETLVPDVGSKIYWFVISANGYGSTPISMISPTAAGAQTDGSGNSYVLSASDGTFDISAWKGCPTANSSQYVVSIGGSIAGGVANPYIEFLTLIPVTCGTSWNVQLSEPQTIAAAYALATFATVATNSFATNSASIQALQAGIAYANTLVNSSTGAYSTSSAWTTTLNTLANMLSACNSSSGGAECPTLFAAATPPSKVAPTNSFQAILDIALNPTLSLSTLFSAENSTSPYQPILSSLPASWVMPGSPVQVVGVSPMPAPVGTSVTIGGSGFGATQGQGMVVIGGVVAAISSWSNTSIVAIVPTGSSDTGAVQVFVDGESSEPLAFNVGPLVTPDLISLSLTQGPIGMGFQIKGFDFGEIQGASTVSMDGNANLVKIINWSSDAITVSILPGGPTSGNIAVHLAGLNSSGVLFTVTPPFGCQ
jgi:IPT/TIG domain